MEIADSVTRLPRRAFAGCALTRAEIPAGVSFCPTSVFDGCTALRDIYFLNPACEIYGDAESSQLEAVVHGYPDSTALDFVVWHQIPFEELTYKDPEWRLEKGVLTVSADGAMGDFRITAAPWLEHSGEITAVVVEEGTTTIAANAFLGCSSLTRLQLPESLRCVGVSAFAGCTGLTALELPENVAVIEGSAFLDCTGLTEFTVPRAALTGRIDGSAFNGCSRLAEFHTLSPDFSVEEGVLFDEGLPTAERRLIAYPLARPDREYTVPESTGSIGSCAFAGCTTLTSVTLPETMNTIYAFAFAGCTNLETVVFPASLRSIQNNAFLDCPGLRDVYLPGIGTLSDGAFHGLNSLSIENQDYEIKSVGNSEMAVVVFGRAGSALEDWAVENGRSFVVLDNP